MGRALELDSADQPPLDARAIVLATSCVEVDTGAPPAASAAQTGPEIAWEGSIQGDGTGPQSSYFVRLYTDGSGHCQCPAYYFRAVLRRDPSYHCKHLVRARAAAGPRA